MSTVVRNPRNRVHSHSEAGNFEMRATNGEKLIYMAISKNEKPKSKKTVDFHDELMSNTIG